MPRVTLDPSIQKDFNSKVTTGLIKRLPWYHEMLGVVKSRSTCKRKQIGSLIINPKTFHIVSMGFNGSPPGMPHCTEEGCLMVEGHCINTLHAELNALANLEGVYDELVMVNTHSPCLNCTKTLMAFRVKTCFYFEDYADSAREDLLQYYKDKHPVSLVKVTLHHS